MEDATESTCSHYEGIAWEVRPEWLVGRHWWRVFVSGHPKVLLRYRENALEIAGTLAADEARFRREAAGQQNGSPRNEAPEQRHPEQRHTGSAALRLSEALRKGSTSLPPIDAPIQRGVRMPTPAARTTG
jgi:hypothetical protein